MSDESQNRSDSAVVGVASHVVDSSSSASKFQQVGASVLLGVQNAIGPRAELHESITSARVVEFNEQQEIARKVYLQTIELLSSLSQEQLESGQRRDSLRFLSVLSSKFSAVFPDAFARVFHTTSRRLSDRAKASAIRFAADFSPESDRSRMIGILLDRLASDSPSEASAAAVALAELGDGFSIPAIKLRRHSVKWKSVLDDVDETIQELSGGAGTDANARIAR